MYRIILFHLFFFAVSNIANGALIKGRITDGDSKEEITGSQIFVKELKTGAISGLDGTYVIKNIPEGSYTIVCSFIGYHTIEKQIIVKVNDSQTLDFNLNPQTAEIGQVVITGHKETGTDQSARLSEKTSNHVSNIVSARTIELSPDLTVASVIRRVSGVTMERNASGEGQYAIIRGMDKRFNYTMVNGIKIPSPDNKNRFVPLDIFPSELLDRLEVTKSITANMEGDGIGGAVNMIMKDAPMHRQLTANLGTGYSTLFVSEDYQSFDHSAISLKSPNEKYGLAYPVQMKDFTTKNLNLNTGTARPDISGGFSYGDRFLKDNIGLMIAGSYQNRFRGNTSDLYSTSSNPEDQQNITHRFYSNQQTRLGLHTKFDVRLSPNSKIMWYSAYMNFRNEQAREAISYNSQTTRLRWNLQSILSSTLKGVHEILDSRLNLDWAFSYGKALNETPDNIQFNEFIINEITSVDQNDGASRRWEHNSDRDLSGYINLSYTFKFENEAILTLSTGGMFRDKVRESYFNEYHFKPYDDSKANPNELIRGVDYNNFDEISFSVNSYGNLSDPLNYDATEKIGAGYFMEKLSFRKIQFIAGVRGEYTNQGYNLKFITEGAKNEGNQEYLDILPSFSFRFLLNRDANLRLTYSKALNRPSFFEIVPYSIIYEEYKERGNPDLNHTTAHNYDLRYEYFPRPSEQFMIGVFYKKIKNPIEFGMMNGYGQDVFYMPMNFGDADNYGMEIDLIKYFSWLGIKANYTFTSSNITTTKMKVSENPDPDAETNIITEYVDQTRPLYGQAGQIINFSLLFKDKRNMWDGQIAFAYTGERLVIVSRYLDEDSWQAGYTSLDGSIERRFKPGFSVFFKVSNLLNSRMIQYIKPNEKNATLANVVRYHDGIVERKEYYGLGLLLGIKINFK